MVYPEYPTEVAMGATHCECEFKGTNSFSQAAGNAPTGPRSNSPCFQCLRPYELPIHPATSGVSLGHTGYPTNGGYDAAANQTTNGSNPYDVMGGYRYNSSVMPSLDYPRNSFAGISSSTNNSGTQDMLSGSLSSDPPPRDAHPIQRIKVALGGNNSSPWPRNNEGYEFPLPDGLTHDRSRIGPAQGGEANMNIEGQTRTSSHVPSQGRRRVSEPSVG